MTHGDLGLVCAMCVFLLDDAWFPPFTVGFFFFFSFPFFFFSVTWFLALLDSQSEEEEGEGETNKVEGGGVTSVSSGCWFDY